eukprot:3584007-Pleurochrysis_carterae.AAC.1
MDAVPHASMRAYRWNAPTREGVRVGARAGAHVRARVCALVRLRVHIHVRACVLACARACVRARALVARQEGEGVGGDCARSHVMLDEHGRRGVGDGGGARACGRLA